MRTKQTLEAYRSKIKQQLQIAQSQKNRFTVMCVELKAQSDLVEGLINTLYPPKTEKTIKVPEKVMDQIKAEINKPVVEKKQK